MESSKASWVHNTEFDEPSQSGGTVVHIGRSNIVNYTFYQSNAMVYSNRLLSAIVTGLNPWTNYSFRVQACTVIECATSDPAIAQTLEASPLNLGSSILTPLADSNGADAGVEVWWSPPVQPNDVITGYDIYRRNNSGLTTGSRS